jgi:hypothetical protein
MSLETRAAVYFAKRIPEHATAHPRADLVGAHFGLVPRRLQSGETDYDGTISKCRDAMMRSNRLYGVFVVNSIAMEGCPMNTPGRTNRGEPALGREASRRNLVFGWIRAGSGP